VSLWTERQEARVGRLYGVRLGVEAFERVGGMRGRVDIEQDGDARHKWRALLSFRWPKQGDLCVSTRQEGETE
jgi:hypothetical protein